VGVDAGTSLIKVVELSKSGEGVSLANWSALPYRGSTNSATQAVTEEQAKAIDAALKKSECKCRDIVVGVPGNNAFIRNIKLPPIPSSKIDQIVRYEIQQTIPFPLENIALDYQVLEPNASSEVEVIMVAMKGEVAESFIRGIEEAKVKVGIMDSIPLALYNCYLYNGYSSADDCTAIIEIGASTSNILIELGGELRYCRAVGIGGNDITNAIAKEFNIPFQQAERIKIQHGIIFPEGQGTFSDDQVRVSRVISGVLDRLLGEIKLTIGYFRSLTSATAISRAVLAGGGAMLKNLKPFLADRLGVQVEIMNPLRKVEVPKNLLAARKVAPVLATAVGLALRNSQDCCRLKISLIPPQIKAAQSRRAKMLYNFGSLIMLAGIVGLLLWRWIPDMKSRADRLAAYDAEIAKYEKHEEQLNELKSTKTLLLNEVKMYSKYVAAGVDPAAPMAMLADSLGNNAYVKDIEIEEGVVKIHGVISSDTKVEELKQLSRLRLELEKYCKGVKTAEQSKTTEGLSFSLELSGVPDLTSYIVAREKQKKEEAAQAAQAPPQAEGA
jgi:type IV pilus assembly protein PilM